MHSCKAARQRAVVYAKEGISLAEKNEERNKDGKKTTLYGSDGKEKLGLGPLIPFLFLLLLLLGPMIAGWTGGSEPIITYSEFKRHVRQGNVSSVTFKGNQITGTFSSPQTLTPPEGEELETSQFVTRKPDFGDDELVAFLETNEVSIQAESDSAPWYQNIMILFLPWIILFGLLFYANRRVQGQMKGINQGGGFFGMGKSRARRFRKGLTHTTFEDVAGLENAKQDLREIVEYLKQPKRFTALGAEIPKGLLLMGPPGAGKTLLARATAGEAGVPFYSISGSEFIEMFVGVGASRVRNMFETAKKEAPAIIFIDEIDSVGRSRGTGVGGGHDEREQTLNQILSEMDGFEPHESVVVIAATNRPDVLDSALTRPGRFDRQVALELPQRKARKEILRIHARKVPLGEDVDLAVIAARTVGFSGADLHNLVNEAALLSGRKSKGKVGFEEFEEATDRILLGIEREDMIEEKERNVIAHHEAGHALVAKLLPDSDPLQKVTIIPRGHSLGSTEQIPANDRHNFPRSYLMSRMAVALGGRAAEKVVFGDLTNGAAQDLKVATKIARKMVCQWGMSDKLGPVTFSQEEEHVFLGREIAQQRDYSEHTAQVIDEEVEEFVRATEKTAEEVITSHREHLDRLAEALLESETLTNQDVDRILSEIDVNHAHAETIGEEIDETAEVITW